MLTSIACKYHNCIGHHLLWSSNLSCFHSRSSAVMGMPAPKSTLTTEWLILPAQILRDSSAVDSLPNRDDPINGRQLSRSIQKCWIHKGKEAVVLNESLLPKMVATRLISCCSFPRPDIIMHSSALLSGDSHWLKHDWEKEGSAKPN